jgi:transposase-like protein
MATGSLRVNWPDIQPALDARLVGNGDLADAIGVNRGTVRTVVKRLRREHAGETSPSRTGRSPVTREAKSIQTMKKEGESELQDQKGSAKDAETDQENEPDPYDENGRRKTQTQIEAEKKGLKFR